MLKLYTGTPGGGKSFHAAQDIKKYLLRGKNVISTMAIDLNVVNKRGRRRTGIFEFMFIQELTPKYLIEFAKKNHRIGKEGQTLLVIDECQILFNPREYNNKERAEWVLFFSIHRHYGYNIILITQFDRLVDRQIRGQVEIEYRHRLINNRGILILLPIKIFAVIEYWYVNKTRLGAHFVRYKRSVGKIYNSYETSDIIAKKLGVDLTALEAKPTAAPALSGDGVGGPPSTRWAARLKDWITSDIKRADVKK